MRLHYRKSTQAWCLRRTIHCFCCRLLCCSPFSQSQSALLADALGHISAGRLSRMRTNSMRLFRGGPCYICQSKSVNRCLCQKLKKPKLSIFQPIVLAETDEFKITVSYIPLSDTNGASGTAVVYTKARQLSAAQAKVGNVSYRRRVASSNTAYRRRTSGVSNTSRRRPASKQPPITSSRRRSRARTKKRPPPRRRQSTRRSASRRRSSRSSSRRRSRGRREVHLEEWIPLGNISMNLEVTSAMKERDRERVRRAPKECLCR